ncbi:hypothetical protein [Flavobacterium sp.]|jgi:hypothetical protein|uniref:hypothetical protein n=1 Tax=Flavobacterium sp. TaxID=239 RepID=UPI0037BF48B7
MDIGELIERFSECKVKEHNDLIEYICNLQIDVNIKNTLLHLIENDNYNDYMQLYNILIENDIELPPLF